MITKQNKGLKKARQSLAQFMRPNIVKYVEVEKPTRTRVKLTRVCISMLENGNYAVGVMRHGQLIDTYKSTYTPNVFESNEHYFAHEKFNEIVTQEELQGFECSDEFEAQTYNVFDKRYVAIKPRPFEKVEFYHLFNSFADKFTCQLIPGGLRVLVKIDCFGVVSIHDFNSENAQSNKENLATKEMQSGFAKLIQKDGFRGLLADGYLYNNKLFITDAGFADTADIANKSLSERLSILTELFKKLELPGSIRFIEPTCGDPQQWLSPYTNGRYKAALVRTNRMPFSCQTTDSANVNKATQAAFVLIDRHVKSYIGNTVEGGLLKATNISNTKDTIKVKYPYKNKLSRPFCYNILCEEEASLSSFLVF